MLLTTRFYLAPLVLVLTACGGGSSGGSNTVAVGGGDSALTGQFIDSAVSGIRYVTATRSGITDSDGQFEYLEGETVSLYIGEQLLGDAPGAQIITLFDLVDGIDPLAGNALKTTIASLNRNRNASVKYGPSFSTVMNLAILLQTLDQDGDPDNGIEITADVAALFAADGVNFNLHWDDFAHERGFRKALAEAKSRELLDSERQVRKSWRAMAHLYASLEVDSKLRANTASTVGRYGSDTPDDTESYTFDDDGKVTRRATHARYSGGYPEAIETYTYDTHGNQVRYENDYDGDGVSNGYIKDSTYDVDGNLTRWEGPTPQGVEAVELYSYDAYGNQTSYEKSIYGSIQYISRETYDDNGYQTYGEYDDEGDGSIEYSSSWSYSGDGYQVRNDYLGGQTSLYSYDGYDNLLRRELNNDSDEALDALYVYTYDTQGNVIRVEDESTGDGAIDYITTKNYDAAGNEIRYEYYEVYLRSTRISTSSYDASGNRTHYTLDNDGDGIPEIHETTTYEYDANGNWVRSEFDRNGDGTTDRIDESTYDANENPILRTIDSDLDGTPEAVYTWEYAADTDGWWSVLHEPQP